MTDSVQQLCFEGQNHLLATDYLAAEVALIAAEKIARTSKDWDSLSRLYMPLQEARRQKRQRAGEGLVKLDWVAQSAMDKLSAEQIASQCNHGQILVAGFGTIQPAVQLRALAMQNRWYLDVFLAASYWVGGEVVVVIVPTDRVQLPEEGEYSIDELTRKLPPHSLILNRSELPPEQVGNTQSFAWTMRIWEKLHQPFLSVADHTQPPAAKIDAYRATIEVDYACELAHQKLSDTARLLLQVEAKRD